jgi:hypothetical protein
MCSDRSEHTTTTRRRLSHDPSSPQPRAVSIKSIKNYKLKITMDKKEIPNKLELPDDDYVVFIPDKEYHDIMRSLGKMEQARQELLNLRESLENGELRMEN